MVAALLRLGQTIVSTFNRKYILIYMTELKHACHCVYQIKEERESCKQMKTIRFQIKTEL